MKKEEVYWINNDIGVEIQSTTHIYDNGEILDEYELNSHVTVEICSDAGDVSLETEGVNYIKHLYDDSSTPIHQIFFQDGDDDRLYITCSKEKFDSLLVTLR